MVNNALPDDSGSLVLENSLRNGMIGVTIVGGLSFACTTFLFTYLTYKLASWRIYYRDSPRSNRDGSPKPSRPQDYSLGIQGMFRSNKRSTPSLLEQVSQQEQQAQQKQQDSRTERLVVPPPNLREHDGPNQFFILIINLLLADMQQSLAFFLDVVWLSSGKLKVGTSSCFAQGMFISTGDLSASIFATIIAVHTYLALVWKVNIPQRALYFIITLAWSFVLLVSILPIAATRNGAAAGGYFVRAGSWCWVNEEYEKVRLLTHYLYIFIAIVTTITLYLLIFISVRREARETISREEETQTVWSRLQASHSPMFFLYPIIYVICTLPLASGRLATMIGAKTPIEYLCFAGALMAANGFFDCVLWSTTRHSILFGPKQNLSVKDIGIDTFTFMQTPADRRFGNMIWVQGGRHQNARDTHHGGWWRISNGRRFGYRDGMSSQESLRGPNIQMDTVTTVMVETDDLKTLPVHMASQRSMKSMDSG